MIEVLGIKYITEKEASHRYGYSKSWFAKQRLKKEEPRFVKLRGKGKVYYELTLIDNWFKRQLDLYD
jgi:hypothetical protein